VGCFSTHCLQVIDFYGAPGMTRTCDLLVRSQTLYPTELRALIFKDVQKNQGPLEASGCGS
jgi:hypothetical protein